MKSIKTSDFDYELPKELIAQRPADPRDSSRMMVLDRTSGSISHRRFTDLPALLGAGDLLVMNDTKVIPARFYATKATGGRVEVLLLEETGPDEWEVLLRASRRPAIGSELSFGEGRGTARVTGEGERGRARLHFSCQGPLLELLEEIGEPPLPPYITRDRTSPDTVDPDRSDYQTIFASSPGAVAAPTAGLHFTDAVLSRLQEAAVQTARVTLHVGIGTFRPVTVENITEHHMDAERYRVPQETVQHIRQTRENSGKVVAVGSTSVRTLESVYREQPPTGACEGRSDLFIYPPYDFKVVDAMLTNFHLPCSTLLMMISAFAGRAFIMEAYRKAVEERYRFFSYGDCMLIL